MAKNTADPLSSQCELKGFLSFWPKTVRMLWVLPANSKDQGFFSQKKAWSFEFLGRTRRIGPFTARNPQAHKWLQKPPGAKRRVYPSSSPRRTPRIRLVWGTFLAIRPTRRHKKIQKMSKKRRIILRLPGELKGSAVFLLPQSDLEYFWYPKPAHLELKGLGGFFAFWRKVPFLGKKNTKFWAKNANLKTRELKGSGCFLPWFFGRARLFWLKNGPKMAIKSWFWY